MTMIRMWVAPLSMMIISIIYGGGCGGKIEAPAELPLVPRDQQAKAAVSILSSPDTAPQGAFRHQLWPTLHTALSHTTERHGSEGPCEVTEFITNQREYFDEGTRLEIGFVSIATSTLPDALTLDTEHLACAQDYPLWKSGESLHVVATGAKFPAFAADILQAAEIHRVEPAVTEPTLTLPDPVDNSEIRTYRPIDMTPTADLRIRWTDEQAGDTIVVEFGGLEAHHWLPQDALDAMSPAERQKATRVRFRWATCTGSGGELTIPKRVIASIHALAPDTSMFGMGSRRAMVVANATATDPAVVLTTWMSEPSAAGTTYHVVYH